MQKFMDLIDGKPGFAQDVLAKTGFNDFTGMNRDGDDYLFVRKVFLEDMMASFNSLADKPCLCKGTNHVFACNTGKPRHLMESSIDSRMGCLYSLKASLMPTTLIYPRTASFRFARASSGSSPWVMTSNSGQYAVYPPLFGSGINSAVICKRCVIVFPSGYFYLGSNVARVKAVVNEFVGKFACFGVFGLDPFDSLASLGRSGSTMSPFDCAQGSVLSKIEGLSK